MGSKFCNKCGTRLPLTCPHCGNPNNLPEAMYCNQCGFHVEEKAITKHGKDGLLYLDEKEQNPMLLSFDEGDVNRIFELSRYFRNILEGISENHEIRMKVGDLSKEVKVTFDIFSKSGEQIAKQSLDR